MISKYVNVVLLFFVIFQLNDAAGKSIVPPNSKGVVGPGAPGGLTTARHYTCQCDDAASPLCANNGVTYKNLCRFECAKHREERLKVIKEGPCGEQTSKVQFWMFGG